MVISNKQLLDEVFVISGKIMQGREVTAVTKHLFIERFMAHRILYLAKTTRGSRDLRVLRVRRDYKLALFAAFGRSLRENYTLF